MARMLYTLEVILTEGPVTKQFVETNPVMSRTIEIRADQTLEQLHTAIFSSFDRSEDHMYEFHLGEDPDELDAIRYGLLSSGETPFLMSIPLDSDSGLAAIDDPVGEVTETTITDLGLTVGRLFGYWFDFEDHWYHSITVLAIGDAEPKAKYPRVIARLGESPPQHQPTDGEDDGCTAGPPAPPDDLQAERRTQRPRRQRRGTDPQPALQFDDE
jgi:hypothetical protein